MRYINILVSLCALHVLAGCDALSDRIDDWRRSDAANVCVDVLRDHLRSPGTMRVLSMHDDYALAAFITKESDDKLPSFSVIVKYEAANAFAPRC